MKIPFTKMQGLGNDFVVIDATKNPFTLSAAQIQQMANRRYGVGFDQLLVLEPATQPSIDYHFRIFNADGSEVGQCGNGARCIAIFIREQQLSQQVKIRLSTLQNILELNITGDHKVSVQMGVPQFLPQLVPFIAEEDQPIYHLKIKQEDIAFSVVNVGNPHAVLQVPRLESQMVANFGPLLSKHELFPEGVNVGFMQVIGPQHIRLRVYERGTGETLACGSGACAAVAVGRRRGLLQERVTVDQPGGSLIIDWQGPKTSLLMTGPGKTVFSGEWIL